jgi:aminoglycoside phosphotransferase (APT) family kinase protein
VSRSPAYLAALASTAVPGLDPASARGVRRREGEDIEVAFVTDTAARQWVVRLPLTAAAGARMDATAALLALLARRLPFHVPVPKGSVAVPEGNAVVYPYLPGRPLDLSALPAGPGLAAELGRTVAAIHNLDRGLYEEAGVPAYDAQTSRARHLADLDRGAATGHVPGRLLSRWERALEDVTLWRFAPTPIHGSLTGRSVLTVFDDEKDASSGHIRAVTGWEAATVADPAEDLADIVTQASAAAVDSVLEGYANSRIERPDPHLRRRARLLSEMGTLRLLLTAVGSGDSEVTTKHAAALRRLEEQTGDDDLAPPPPIMLRPRPVIVPVVVEEQSPTAPPEREAGAAVEVTEVIPADQLAALRAAAATPTSEPGEVIADGATQEIPAHQLAKATGALTDTDTPEPDTPEPASDEPASDEPASDEPASDEPASDEPGSVGP